MPYSEIVDGKVFDYHFKYLGGSGGTFNFYIGDLFVGQVFKRKKGVWDAVPWTKNPIGVVNGFRSRLDAAEYCLKWFRENRNENT